MNALRIVSAILITAAVAAAYAQQQRIVHRTGVAPGEAAPTDGSFSIDFPVKFSDIELRVEDPNAPLLIVRVLTGINEEGLRFSATEIPVQGPPQPFDQFLEAVKKRPGTTATDVHQEKSGDTETLSFELAEPKADSYFRQIRTKTTGYTLVMQFPKALEEKADEMKSAFFGSFKITRP